MLTAIELENFKGFGLRQRIELAPITLLFGANSAGKSTILQSLLYLHELIERGDADVDRTELGGQVVELGGFARLVHRHERERAIVVRAEFSTAGQLEAVLRQFGRDPAELVFEDLDDSTDRAWVELTVTDRVSAGASGPAVDRVAIGLGDHRQPLVILGLGPTLRENEPLDVRINMRHPSLGAEPYAKTRLWYEVAAPSGSRSRLDDDAQQEDPDEVAKQEAFAQELARVLPPFPDTGKAFVSFEFSDGKLIEARMGAPTLDFALSRGRLSALPYAQEPLRLIPFAQDGLETTTADAERGAAQVRTFLEVVVLGVMQQLRAALRGALYVGPLRAVPTRGSL